MDKGILELFPEDTSVEKPDGSNQNPDSGGKEEKEGTEGKEVNEGADGGKDGNGDGGDGSLEMNALPDIPEGAGVLEALASAEEPVVGDDGGDAGSFDVESIFEELKKDGLLPEDAKPEDFKGKKPEEIVKEVAAKAKEAVGNPDELKVDAIVSFVEELPEQLRDLVTTYINKGEVGDVSSIKEGMDDIRAEEIVKQSLKELGFEDDEIKEEIEIYKKNNLLSKKAKALHEKAEAKRKEQLEKKRKETYEKYVSGLEKDLAELKVSGMDVPDNVKEDIKKAMVEAKYDSLTGKKVNELGYLLEKYQFVEPDFKRVAKAMWILKDPEGFEKYYESVISRRVNEELEKDLKMKQQSRMKTGSDASFNEDTKLQKRNKGGKIDMEELRTRMAKGLFGR